MPVGNGNMLLPPTITVTGHNNFCHPFRLSDESLRNNVETNCIKSMLMVLLVLSKTEKSDGDDEM